LSICSTGRRWPSTLAVVLLAGAVIGCGVKEIDLAHPSVPAATTPAGGAGGNPSPAAMGGSGGSGGTNPVVASDAAAAPPTPGTRTDAAPAGGPAPPPPSSGPPLSGTTVSINGMAVPREKAIVILHIGHSNMAGRAKDPAALMPYFYDTDPHLWTYHKGGMWTPAKEWTAPDGGTPGVHPSNQGAGPGMALLRKALTFAPDAYIISIGQGESLDYGVSCPSFRKGGLFHDKIAGPALELKGKVTFAGLFVMLGYDARTAGSALNGGFLACLQALINDFRTDLGAPDLPLIQNDYERGATGSFSPMCCGAPQVIAQLAQVPMTISRSVLVPTEGIEMQDDHHFDMAGHKEWADRVFKGMADKGLLPWATVKP